MNFNSGDWENTIDVRDFIQKNYTPYDGDGSFLTGPTERTKKLWEELSVLLEKERNSPGRVLDADTKVISGITLTMTSAKAGFGAGHTKTVYLRKSNYQNATTEATGGDYVGDALGTFAGSFYNNTTSYDITGTLLSAMAAYIAAGNNTFTIYNPSPSASYEGYTE